MMLRTYGLGKNPADLVYKARQEYHEATDPDWSVLKAVKKWITKKWKRLKHLTTTLFSQKK